MGTLATPVMSTDSADVCPPVTAIPAYARPVGVRRVITVPWHWTWFFRGRDVFSARSPRCGSGWIWSRSFGCTWLGIRILLCRLLTRFADDVLVRLCEVVPAGSAVDVSVTLRDDVPDERVIGRAPALLRTCAIWMSTRIFDVFRTTGWLEVESDPGGRFRRCVKDLLVGIVFVLGKDT